MSCEFNSISEAIEAVKSLPYQFSNLRGSASEIAELAEQFENRAEWVRSEAVQVEVVKAAIGGIYRRDHGWWKHLQPGEHIVLMGTGGGRCMSHVIRRRGGSWEVEAQAYCSHTFQSGQTMPEGFTKVDTL